MENSIYINMTEILMTYPQFILKEIRKTDFIQNIFNKLIYAYTLPYP